MKTYRISKSLWLSMEHRSACELTMEVLIRQMHSGDSHVKQEFTVPITHQQNRVAGLYKRVITEGASNVNSCEGSKTASGNQL